MEGIPCTSERASGPTPEQAVARAVAYLHAHSATPVSVAQLCRFAGISERGLRNAFRRSRGTSPKQFMVAERLRAVREVLTDASAAALTVTEAATSYGFFELGRFAAAYKKMYGEAPSQTLRARRHRAELRS